MESAKAEHKFQAQLLLDQVLAVRRSQDVGEEESSLAALRQSAASSSAYSVDASDPHYDPAAAWGCLSTGEGMQPSTKPTRSLRVGIAGPPGAGKSTFIEALGTQLAEGGWRVAVIAVDPSSTRHGGSILGDKTRMTELSRHPNAFVRPAPTRGALGGVAEHTNDVVLLCEAAGYDVVLVETVGLGQSEVAVDGTVDMLALVVPPAGGDELQGVKKGIMEVADAVVVNKADGPLAAAAAHATAEVRRAFNLSRRKHPQWKQRAMQCSSLEGSGVHEVWGTVSDFWRVAAASGLLQTRRQAQASAWAVSNAHALLTYAFDRSPAAKASQAAAAGALEAGLLTPRAAGLAAVQAFLAEAGEA